MTLKGPYAFCFKTCAPWYCYLFILSFTFSLLLDGGGGGWILCAIRCPLILTMISVVHHQVSKINLGGQSGSRAEGVKFKMASVA